MSMIMLSGPVLEPVSLAEAKAFLRLDDGAEDALVASLIATSRAHIETALGLGLVTQSWRLAIDQWPADGTVEVPIAPLGSLTAVRTRFVDSASTDLALSSFIVDRNPRPARIALRPGVVPLTTEPIAGIELDVIVGFGDRPIDVPAPIRHALLLLVAHWYEHREPALVGHTATRIPCSVSDLLQPWREVRL